MQSFLGVDMTKNLSLFTIPAALVTCMIPNIWGVVLVGKSYDNAYPRNLRDRVSGDENLEKARKQTFSRAKSASENGFETLGFYAAAVVAANHAGLDAGTLNALSIGYIVSRLAYIFAYIVLGANRKLAVLRSLAWMVGVGCTMLLYVKAGLVLMVDA